MKAHSRAHIKVDANFLSCIYGPIGHHPDGGVIGIFGQQNSGKTTCGPAHEALINHLHSLVSSNQREAYEYTMGYDIIQTRLSDNQWDSIKDGFEKIFNPSKLAFHYMGESDFPFHIQESLDRIFDIEQFKSTNISFLDSARFWVTGINDPEKTNKKQFQKFINFEDKENINKIFSGNPLKYGVNANFLGTLTEIGCSLVEQSKLYYLMINPQASGDENIEAVKNHVASSCMIVADIENIDGVFTLTLNMRGYDPAPVLGYKTDRTEGTGLITRPGIIRAYHRQDLDTGIPFRISHKNPKLTIPDMGRWVDGTPLSANNVIDDSTENNFNRPDYERIASMPLMENLDKIRNGIAEIKEEKENQNKKKENKNTKKGDE